MIESITHNNENLILLFNENALQVSAKFNDGTDAFFLDYSIFRSSLKITDFKVYKKRDGLGTNVLKELEVFSKKKGIKKIYGDFLNSPDHSPPEVLNKFYTCLLYTSPSPRDRG